MSSTANFHEMIREKRIVELDGGRNGPLDRGASNNFLEVTYGVKDLFDSAGKRSRERGEL